MIPPVKQTQSSPTRRTRKIFNGTRSCNAASFWPTDRPYITDINKGRRPETSYCPTSPSKHTTGDRQGVSEGSLADRSTVLKVLDKISVSGRQSYVRKVLRSYDSSNTGFLSKDDLRTAMDRLALGLDDNEKTKVAARLDPENSNRIPVDKLVTSFEEDLEPLGHNSYCDRRIATMTRPPYSTMRRCMTPCGMSMKTAEGLGSTNSFTLPLSHKNRRGNMRLREPPTSVSDVPLATQMDIQTADLDAALRAPETYALQQQLFFKGQGKAQQALFQARDACGKGSLPLETLTDTCQVIVPGMKARDVAALVVAVDPSSNGHVNYRHFVSSLVDWAPVHEKLLPSGTQGFETEHEKWGASPITRQPAPITPGARFPTARSPSATAGALFSDGLACSKSAAVGTRVGAYVSEKPFGTEKDFRYGQPDVCDAQGEIDERKLVHAVSVAPIVQSLTTAHREGFQTQGQKQRFAYLSTSMPELPTRPGSQPLQYTSRNQNSDLGARQPQDTTRSMAQAPSLRLASLRSPQMPPQQKDKNGSRTCSPAKGMPAAPGPLSRSTGLSDTSHSTSGLMQPTEGNQPSAHNQPSLLSRISGALVPTCTFSSTRFLSPARVHSPSQCEAAMSPRQQEVAGESSKLAEPSSPPYQARMVQADEQMGVFQGDNPKSGSRSRMASRGSPTPSRSGSATLGASGGGEGFGSAARDLNGFGAVGSNSNGAWAGASVAAARVTAGTEAEEGVTAADLFKQSKGRNRFRHLNYPGTCHTVEPIAGTSQYLEPSARFVRKGDAAFLDYQAEDSDRKAKLAQQQLKTTSNSINTVAQRVERDEAWAACRDAANLEALANTKHVWVEHMHSMDIVRSLNTRKVGTLFGNSLGKSCFKEHLDSAAFFNRT